MQSIFRKEIVCLVRDRRLLILTGIVLLLLVVALFSGYNRFAAIDAERKALNEESRKDWETQEEKNAHSAAHYGSYLFAPQPPLSFFDFGILNFTGNTVRLEAHKQHEPTYAAANESGGNIRFGDMTVALVLQALLPLLIIFLSFGSISGEKENNTLKLLLIQGGAIGKIIWQKIAAFYSVAVVILFSIILIGAVFLVFSGVKITTSLITGLVLLFLLYSSFYFVLTGACVLVSAVAKTSRNALMVLLAFWLISVVLFPKYIANVADNLYPLPSRKTMQLSIKKDVEEGIDGHDPSNLRSKQFLDSVLKVNNVKTAEELKINIDGLLMQEDENYRAMVISKYSNQLNGQIRQQNIFSQAVSFINPYLALKDLSMAISGSDFNSYASFESQAYAYRLYMMRYLNEYLSYNSKTGDWESKAPREVFTALKKFEYQPLPVGKQLQHYKLLIMSICCWIMIMVVLINLTARTFKIV
jgi:ABC-2 type transport system permease protein